MNLGDIRLGDTIDFKFTSRRFTTGAPFTLAGTPVISAYVGNSTTELTAGITLTVDFDSRTGLNHVRIVATSGNGYATASNYELVITTGTVDSVSVVGEVVAMFSIEARSALMPTTATRTLDVSAGGEAGLDWANIGSPTTTVAFTGTTIATTQKVDVETIKTNPVVNAGTVTFPAGATLASTTNITAGTIATVTTLTNLPAITANWLTAAGINAGALNGKGDWLLASSYTAPSNLTAAQIATGVWQDATAGDFTVASSIGKSLYIANIAPGAAGGHFIAGANAATTVNFTGNITGNLTGSVGSVTGLTTANLDVAVSSRLAAASYTTPPTANENADGLLARNVAGGSSAGRLVKEAFYVLRNKTDIQTGTLTVYGTDDTTAAFTAAVTTAAGNPITTIDPA